jgi:hypothetical protein
MSTLVNLLLALVLNLLGLEHHEQPQHMVSMNESARLIEISKDACGDKNNIPIETIRWVEQKHPTMRGL